MAALGVASLQQMEIWIGTELRCSKPGPTFNPACLAVDKCDSVFSSGCRVTDISSLCHLSAQLNSSSILLKQSLPLAQARLKLQDGSGFLILLTLPGTEGLHHHSEMFGGSKLASRRLGQHSTN